MDELSYQKAFEYVELIAENTRQDQSVIKKAIKVLYNHKIKGEKAGTKLRMMISKINQVGKLDEVFLFVKNNADYRNLSEAEINEVIKKLFSNYATDAAMILFDNIDEWAEWGTKMEKEKCKYYLKFKGYALKGKKAGITANYSEPIDELVQIRINSEPRQQMLEFVLRFKNNKNNSRAREYRVNKDVFDTATDYLNGIATSNVMV